MAKVRLYILEPPGSPNCPPGKTGCVNSGLLDPDTGECGADPKQFNNLNDLLSYANGRGEQTRSVANAAEVDRICNTTRYSGGGSTPGISGFDFSQFLKSPLAVLALIAITVIVLLRERG